MCSVEGLRLDLPLKGININPSGLATIYYYRVLLVCTSFVTEMLLVTKIAA